MNNKGTVLIETDRLILRRFKQQDAKDIYENWANDDEVTKYLTWPTHQSVDVSQKVLDSWIADYKKDDFYQWVIELKDKNEGIGSISVVNTKKEIYGVEIGYCIGRKFWGQGITSEAFKAVIKFLFEEVDCNRIAARHDVNNPSSGKVMQKCGLELEGIHKEADRNNTGICDMAVYGLIKGDYKTMHKYSS